MAWIKDIVSRYTKQGGELSPAIREVFDSVVTKENLDAGRAAREAQLEALKSKAEPDTRTANKKLIDNKQKEYQDKQIAAANEKFNKELEAFADPDNKTLGEGHIFKLGEVYKGSILNRAGFTTDEILMTSDKLAEKKGEHTFTEKDIKNLVEALHDPVAVLDYKEDGLNVVVELRKGNKNFIVGVRLNQNEKESNITVTKVTTVFDPSDRYWTELLAKRLKYANTDKLKALVNLEGDNSLTASKKGFKNINNILALAGDVKEFFPNAEQSELLESLAKEDAVTYEQRIANGQMGIDFDNIGKERGENGEGQKQGNDGGLVANGLHDNGGRFGSGSAGSRAGRVSGKSGELHENAGTTPPQRDTVNLEDLGLNSKKSSIKNLTVDKNISPELRAYINTFYSEYGVEKEFRNENDGTRIYSIEAVDIENMGLQDIDGEQAANNTHTSSRKHLFFKANPL